MTFCYKYRVSIIILGGKRIKNTIHIENDRIIIIVLVKVFKTGLMDVLVREVSDIKDL